MTGQTNFKKIPPEPVATEEEEQIAVMQWAALFTHVYPELALLHHIPNGGKRGKREAIRFQAMGVKPGIPDLFLPAPRGRWHGLYIEMKRKGGYLSAEQKRLHPLLAAQGYAVCVCFGAEQAIEAVKGYLCLDKCDEKLNNSQN